MFSLLPQKISLTSKAAFYVVERSFSYHHTSHHHDDISLCPPNSYSLLENTEKQIYLTNQIQEIHRKLASNVIYLFLYASEGESAYLSQTHCEQ